MDNEKLAAQAMQSDMTAEKKETITVPFRPDEDAPYIFISYAHADRERVYPIITQLYEAGWPLLADATVAPKADEPFILA